MGRAYPATAGFQDSNFFNEDGVKLNAGDFSPFGIQTLFLSHLCSCILGPAGAEIKVPSGENTELKRSPFKAWRRSVYSKTCYAYCQGFFPCLFLPFRSIHLHFFQNLSHFFVPVRAFRINKSLCLMQFPC